MKQKITQTALIISLLTSPFATSLFAQANEEIEVTTEETRMVTFLGVETSRISNALRNHIDLPEGVGLTISHIASDSGAAKADLQQYDILHKVDDQIIINQDQLRTYIRSKEPGDTVRLEVMRKGKTLKVPVRLGEREESKNRNFGQNWPFPNPMPRPFEDSGDFDFDFDFDFNSEEFQKKMEEFGKKASEFGNRAMQFIPEVMIEHEEEDGSTRITSVGRGPNKVSLRKDDLMAEMLTKNGTKTYVIKQFDGDEEKILYEGGALTDADMEKLPVEVKALVERLNSSESFDWKNMEQMMNQKTRIIINTGEDEASIEIEKNEEEA